MSLMKTHACPECESTSLTWQAVNTNKSGIPEGRLRTHEVTCIFVLGCDDCSETIATVSADKIASALPAGDSIYPFQTGAYEVELGQDKWSAVHSIFENYNSSEIPSEEFTCTEGDVNGLVSEILITLDLARAE